MKKVPVQHLLFAHLDEEFGCIRHGKECELPILVQARTRYLGRIPVTWESVFCENDSFNNRWVFYSKRSSKPYAFVMCKDVCRRDVEVI